MEKCIIVAKASDGAIGRGNGLLWHISADLRMFKSLTMGCPVIMGRRTFLSIGRALPGRRNIVVSRGGFAAPAGVEVVSSLDQAFALCGNLPRCFVIGGGQLYSAALPAADRLYVTEVHAKYPDADTFFPAVDAGEWREVSRSPVQTDEASGLQYQFVESVRILR